MGDENKFAVADAVEPEKPKRREIIMPRWVLIAWCAVVLAVGGYASVFLFSPMGVIESLLSLGMMLNTVLSLAGIVVLGLAIRFSKNVFVQFSLFVLMVPLIIIILVPAAVAGVAWLSVIWVPIGVLLLFVGVVGVFASGFEYQSSLSMLFITIGMGIGGISLNAYTQSPHEVVSSTTIDDRSYHYILWHGFLDPTIARLYECNRMGFYCEQLYTSDQRQYTQNDTYTWQIDRGNETRITLFVNGQVINEVVVE
ncbi:MAG: hypothetical protein AAFV33_12540 [Chloroflexota bacterium]